MEKTAPFAFMSFDGFDWYVDKEKGRIAGLASDQQLPEQPPNFDKPGFLFNLSNPPYPTDVVYPLYQIVLMMAEYLGLVRITVTAK
jgi:hypothetical protein